MAVLIKIIQLILALSILVIIHEFGHFLASRIFGVRVEKFYMFFDWKFSIFRCKKVNGKWRFKFFRKNEPEKYITHETTNPLTNKKEYTYEKIDLNTLPEDDWRRAEDSTEFGLGWVPLGGYCKIAGMIDESMDQAQMAQEPQPWEFRTKPAWQRLIIMIGGVCMNVILAIVIYIGLIAHYGEQYISTEEVNKYGITVDSLGYNLGLRDGDKILTINGEYIEDFSEIPMHMILEKTEYIEVERDGEKMVVELPEDAVNQILKARSMFISTRMPFVVGGFSNGSYAEKAGLLVNDQIIGINEVETPYFQDFKKEIVNHRDEDINLMVVRDIDTLTYVTHVGGDATIGVYAAQMLQVSTKEYTFWQSIPRGFRKTGKELRDYWRQLKLIVNPSTGAYESLGGFIAIGSIFPDTFIWEQFWRMTAFLSIILAVMNILPIPGLDGGHVLFLIWEVITGRKPSDKFLERATTIGFIFLLMLLIYANGNDIIRLFR
ncbi:MAG: RIP metalloprotease RseP [Bacteroidales bacterium]|nr:RIP metalloprotease RseP [Bacteroidales bacterium]MCR5036417.1 RIP metalloprotease RseP [Bacteroidales bacterium]